MSIFKLLTGTYKERTPYVDIQITDWHLQRENSSCRYSNYWLALTKGELFMSIFKFLAGTYKGRTLYVDIQITDWHLQRENSLCR
jgi:hypothetical protein